MKTSIIIATYNKFDFTQKCIDSIRQYTAEEDYEIIIVDNDSKDETRKWLRQQKDIITILNESNLGFPKACNQGIEIAAGDNILLLNNDTIVTENWLINLLTCLYSSNDIGAVGAVTNYCSYYQTIPVSYQNIEEMHVFASAYNQSNSSQWEERLKLIGYCMLIKRSIVENIGLLDEKFTPGNYEDDDYSLRIRKAGSRLMLCKDTFIHHYGSTSFKDNYNKFAQLIQTNRTKFMDKWGFDPDEANIIRTELVDLINNPREEAIRVLEVGCRCGGTLLAIKNAFPKAELHGIDSNYSSLEVAGLFVHMVNGNSEGILSHFEEGYFDYIIFGDNLHEIDQASKTLAVLRNYLKADGKLIGSVPNLMHHEMIANFIRGTLSKAQLGYYNLSDVKHLFENSGYKNIQITGLSTSKSTEDNLFIQGLTNLMNSGTEQLYEVQKFVVRASKMEASSTILALLEDLQLETNIDSSLSNLQELDVTGVMETIVLHMENPIELLNRLAILYFQRRNNDHILPYLNKAYELDNLDPNTLYNLGYVMYSFGEVEIALKYLQMINDKDDDIIQLIQEIVQHPLIKRGHNLMEVQQNGFKNMIELLLEIDSEQNVLENAKELLQRIQDNEELMNELNQEIHDNIENKVDVYNLLAVTGFENEIYDPIIPLLQKSLEFDPFHKDSLINMGIILSKFGEENLALSYLNKITEKDEGVLQLIQSLYDRLNSVENVENKRESTEQQLIFHKFGQRVHISNGHEIVGAEAISIGNDVVIRKNCWLYADANQFRNEPQIIIDDGCQIGKNFSLSVANKAVIEKHVIIAPNVYITDCGHNYENIALPIRFQGVTSSTNVVSIGEGSWLGVNSVIFGNVRVGKGCVVGANTFVNKDVPDYSVVVGNPAQVIKMFDTVSNSWMRVRNVKEVREIIVKRTEQPLLSICIPTFNRANDLDRCLESIFNQIGIDPLFEVFISNNSSSDQTEEVVKKYQEQFETISYNKNTENIGAERNILLTLQQSKGQYILLHGDDDFFNNGILRTILNVIMNNKQCGLFFLNVLNDNKEVKVLQGMNSFLQETSIYSSFISSVIVSREEFDKLKDPFKFIGTFFNHIYLQYSILEKNPNFCIINDSAFTYAGNKPVEYNYGEVFIKSYLDILTYFKDRGLSEQIIKEDKKIILYNLLLPRLQHYSQMKMNTFISDFDHYFDEYYQDEPFYDHAREIVELIRAQNS